ncbi:MAG: TetR/AcrR family transcriptional regulator [Alistipes sp.]|nr:TetR/AcrR family transcriptional regulator [Alistipes sp.]
MTQKENIIHHASKMFVEQGIKAVRMDDIAQELGISKRTLYELFSDKEELIYQSLRHYMEDSRDRRMHHISDIDNPLEIMVVNLRDMIDASPVAGRIRRNIRRFYPSIYKRLEDDVQSKSKADLERWVAGCMECGYFEKSVKVRFAVDVLHHSVHGMLVNTLDEERPSSEHVEMMSYSLLVFIRGLCTVDGQRIIDECTTKYFNNI